MHLKESGQRAQRMLGREAVLGSYGAAAQYPASTMVNDLSVKQTGQKHFALGVCGGRMRVGTEVG